jgi:two-component system, NarL family, nitrate/nitrite response regulator NarL
MKALRMTEVAKKPIQLLLVDGDPRFRKNVMQLLVNEPDITVVGQFATLSEARRVLMTRSVDVVMLDYESNEDVGPRLLETFPTLRSAPSFLLVTAGMEVNELHRALDAGASGVVLKHGEPRQLLHAIRAVAQGNQWWDESALHTGHTPLKRSVEVDRPTITERQRQILHHILDGLSNKEIGATLGVSESAVKASIQELFHKTGVRTRGQLVRIALEGHSEDWLKPHG